MRDCGCQAAGPYPDGPGDAGRRRLGSDTALEEQARDARHPCHRPVGLSALATELVAKRLELGFASASPHSPRQNATHGQLRAVGYGLRPGHEPWVNSRVGSTFRLEKKLEQNRLEQTGEKALKLFRTLTAAGFIAAAAAVPATALDISTPVSFL